MFVWHFTLWTNKQHVFTHARYTMNDLNSEQSLIYFTCFQAKLRRLIRPRLDSSMLMKMILVPTNGLAFAHMPVRVPEPPVHSVLLLVDSSQRAVLFHRHVYLLQHSVTLDQKVSLRQCCDTLPLLGLANDLWLERARSVGSRSRLLLRLCIHVWKIVFFFFL